MDIPAFSLLCSSNFVIFCTICCFFLMNLECVFSLVFPFSSPWAWLVLKFYAFYFAFLFSNDYVAGVFPFLHVVFPGISLFSYCCILYFLSVECEVGMLLFTICFAGLFHKCFKLYLYFSLDIWSEHVAFHHLVL